jgi:hypothetical protein
MKTRKNVYWLLAILSLAGYAWVGFNLAFPDSSNGFTVCLFRNVTGVPCPSCGITRSLLLFMSGNFREAMLLNPLGGFAALALIAAPLWIIFDLAARKNTLHCLFLWTERKIKTKKSISIPLVALVLLNWGWNILKDL